MEPIRSPGISSGLDVNAIVTQLVAAERAPAAQRIQRQDTKLATQISALGALRGSLANLQSSVNPLKSQTAFQTRTVDSSNSGVVSGTATATAASGSFAVEVRQVASAQRIISGAVAGGAGAVVGTGTLTLSMGGSAFDVIIDDTNSSLNGIRDAINGAANNTGVRASIINTADGARLVLAARDTGAANTIRVAQAGGNGGLAAIVYDPPTTSGNYTELEPAQDALIRVEGFDVTSTTNTFTGAIDGVTINAVGAAPGSIQTLTIGNDQKATTERIQKFVTDFNSAANTLSALRRYNPTTREAGPLLGDALLRGIESEVRRQISTAVTTADSAYTSLAAVGITTTKEGKLQIDDAKLQAALTADFDAVGRLFASTDGVTARLGATLDKALASDAQIANRTTNMQNQRRTLEKDTAALDRRMEAVEARYRAQFTSLDTALAGLQSTANFLTQQLTNRSVR